MANYLQCEQFSKKELVRHIETCLQQLQDGIAIQEHTSNFLSSTVQELLDYTKTSSNQFSKNLSSFNIRDTVQKVVSLQSKKAESLGLTVSTSFVNISRGAQVVLLDSIFSPIIVADESRIFQVLLGLQSNALKYTEKGHI